MMDVSTTRKNVDGTEAIVCKEFQIFIHFQLSFLLSVVKSTFLQGTILLYFCHDVKQDHNNNDLVSIIATVITSSSAVSPFINSYSILIPNHQQSAVRPNRSTNKAQSSGAIPNVNISPPPPSVVIRRRGGPLDIAYDATPQMRYKIVILVLWSCLCKNEGLPLNPEPELLEGSQIRFNNISYFDSS